MKLLSLHKRLSRKYEVKDWWPVKHKTVPKKWEVCVGVVLTQNTSWVNAEKALQALAANNTINPKAIASARPDKLKQYIRSAGFYNQKSHRLKSLAQFALSFNSVDDFLKKATRNELLAIKGIGKESADSIMLYACNKPYFVIDAYTKRLLNRLDISGEKEYDRIQQLFYQQLPLDTKLYQELHALIVEHAKQYCKSNPLCQECILRKKCPYA